MKTHPYDERKNAPSREDTPSRKKTVICWHLSSLTFGVEWGQISDGQPRRWQCKQMSTDYSYFLHGQHTLVHRPEMLGASAWDAWCIALRCLVRFLNTLVLWPEEQGLIAGRTWPYGWKDLTFWPEGLDLRAWRLEGLKNVGRGDGIEGFSWCFAK